MSASAGLWCWDGKTATLDNRTRHAHAMLDGQQAEMGKPFKVDGYDIMFPGDTSAPAYLVYNCRCTLIAAVDGADTSDAQRRARNPETGRNELVSDMSYQEWAGWKKSTKQVASDDANGIISTGRLKGIGLQFFTNNDIQKWKTKGLEKAVGKWEKRISEHEDKIKTPSKYDPDWENKIQIAKDGEIYHWKKEIRNFEGLIEQAKAELKKRGKQ